MEDYVSSCAVRYYCTVGKGMEPFLTQEAKLKLSAYDVDQIDGKVFFTTLASIVRVKELKAAERLFLLLKRDPPLLIKSNTAGAGPLIQERMVGDSSVWTSSLSSWKQLQESMSRSNCDPDGAGRGRKRKREETSGLDTEACSGRRVQELERLTGEGPSCRNGDSRVKGSAENSLGTEGRCSTQEPSVTFRVCCRCSGALAKHFSAQDLGRIIGTAISRRLGWKADLRKPDLEVNVHLSDDHCVLGIPLLRHPLASRSYIKTAGLRSTIAWAMASLADIKPGSCVVDPMCGVGTILLEASHEYKNAFFLGMDIDGSQLRKAWENVCFANIGSRLQLLQSSSTAIPLASSSMDAVICDVPFGRKFGNKADIAAILPALVREMERVLCLDGLLVLLLSPQLSVLLRKSIPPGSAALSSPSASENPTLTPSIFPSLQPQGLHRVSLGATDALIHRYRKVLITPKGPD